jgi:hypothetical protein
MGNDFIRLWNFYLTALSENAGASQYVIVFTGVRDF